MKSPVNASAQLAPAVSTVEISRIFLWPIMSPSFARIGTTMRRQQQLGGLEPVEVGVADAQVLDEVGDERHVEALQDATGELDEEQPADQPERDGARAGLQR